MTSSKQINEKVKQVLYGGDSYNAGEVFDSSEYTRAKRVFDDYASHPRAEGIVVERAETAIEQIEGDGR